MHADLANTIASILPEVDGVPVERKSKLDRIASWVSERRTTNQPADLIFICTHNSRRSIFAQVWAATAARHYGITGVRTWSGGVETTAINFNVTAVLLAQGFQIDGSGDDENPEVAVHVDDVLDPVICFSKTYDDPHNPSQHFAAVIVCTNAEEACPNPAGADLKVSLPYDDPKSSDGTGTEREAYGRSGRGIAREMLYLFSRC